MRLSFDTPISFRFSPEELAKLDKLVQWERDKGPQMWPRGEPNRTNVLKALIARELLRLADEKAKIAEKLKKNNPAPWEGDGPIGSAMETPTQRKTRLQKIRRANKRTQAATT